MIATLRPKSRRAFATFLVIWVLALGVVFVAEMQRHSFRQAAAGREALARSRASWAARGGVEAAIACLEYDTENPDQTDAFAVYDDLADAARGDLMGASYLVSHTTDPGSRNPGDVLGPADAHAKLNVNLMTAESLMLLPYMTQDVADAILDWIDPDDDIRPQGAEIGQYQSGPHPYEPRNALIRSMAEIELVVGVEPWYVRDEDWNLNGLMEPGEDDGDDSWPDDNRDRKLQAGWAGVLTAASAGDILGESGEARLVLEEASESDIAKRLGVDNTQAKAIADLAAAGITIPQFVASDLQTLMNALSGGGGGGPNNNRARYQALTVEQLALLLAETVEIAPEPSAPRPGKLNINTCPVSMFEYVPGLPLAVADAIAQEREARAMGFLSPIDLLEVQGVSRARLASLLPMFTTRSNVFVVNCTGTDERTGIEVGVVATIDRSTLPATITEWRIR